MLQQADQNYQPFRWSCIVLRPLQISLNKRHLTLIIRQNWFPEPISLERTQNENQAIVITERRTRIFWEKSRIQRVDQLRSWIC